MKELSKSEFKLECESMKLKGKCAVLIQRTNLFTVMNYQNGEVSLDIFVGRDEDSLNKAIKEICNVNKEHIKNATGLLVNFNIHPDFSFMNIENMMMTLNKHIPDELNMTFTSTYDDSLKSDYAKVSILISRYSKFTLVINKLLKPFQRCFSKDL